MKRHVGGDIVGKGSFGCIVKIQKTRKESFVYKMITLVRNTHDLKKQLVALSISKHEYVQMGLSHLISESVEAIKEIDNSRILTFELSKPENRQYRRFFALIESHEDVIFENETTLRNRGLKSHNITECRAYFIDRVSAVLQRAAALRVDLNLDIALLKMRYINGINLREYVNNSEQNRAMYRNHPSKFIDLCYQSIRALAFMHQSHIIHRDIKSENIMMDRDMDCPVYIDFGFSRNVTPTSTVTVNDYRYGTPIFKPPESVMMYSNISKAMLPILLRQMYRDDSTILHVWDPIHSYTRAYIETTMDRIVRQYRRDPTSIITVENLMKFDVFSLGCTLYENFTTIYPYEEYRTDIWATVLNNLFLQMMNPDVFNRITSETAKNIMFNHRTTLIRQSTRRLTENVKRKMNIK